MNKLFSMSVLLAGAALFALPAEAARLYSVPALVEVPPGGSIEVSWFLDTEGERVNAFEGALAYPASSLSLSQISTGNSIVSLWVENPRVRDGALSFSGVIPGGYRGSEGKLFSTVVRGGVESSGELSLRNGAAFINDGKGTPTSLYLAPVSVAVKNDARVEGNVATLRDRDAPEIGTSSIVRESDLYGGAYALLWVAQDKNSGVSRFEVCEGKRPCAEAQSPYLLYDQSRSSDVVLKAYDAEGNVAEVVIPAEKGKNPRLAFDDLIASPYIWILLVGIIAFFAVRYGTIKRKRNRT
jgi:hypothetical protein